MFTLLQMLFGFWQKISRILQKLSGQQCCHADEVFLTLGGGGWGVRIVGDISFQKMYGLYGLKHHRHSRGCSFVKLVVRLKKLALSLIVPDHLWQVVNDIAQGMEKLPLLHHSWTDQ